MFYSPRRGVFWTLTRYGISFIEEIKKSTSKLSFDMFFSDLSLYKLDVDNKIIYIQLEDISIIKFLERNTLFKSKIYSRECSGMIFKWS